LAALGRRVRLSATPQNHDAEPAVAERLRADALDAHVVPPDPLHDLPLA